MKKMFLILVLAMMIAVQPVSAQNADKQPFCTTCELENLNADVYVVIADEIGGQLISGQFARIAYSTDQLKDVDLGMSPEEIAKFLASNGFSYLKEGGDAYFIVKLGNQYLLVEVDRLGGSYGPLKIQTYEKIIRQNLTPFLQVVIPRPQKQST